MSEIHPTAIIAPGARLGADVTVGPYCVIEDDVAIGDGSHLGPHVTVLAHTTLGASCRVHAGAVLGDLPQDLAFGGGESYVRIGDGCTIREGVTIHRGTKPGTVTEVGDACFLMAFSHLAHNVKLGRRVVLANGALLGGYVEAGDGAFISGSVLVHQFCRVGRLAMLGGGAGISQDVPPFMTAVSTALNKLSGLNVVGLRRAGVGPEDRQALKRAFRLLFRSGLLIRDAVQRLRESETSPLVEELCAFIETAKRGVCGARASAAGDPED